MKRRAALKAMGALVVCWAGHGVPVARGQDKDAPATKYSDIYVDSSVTLFDGPMDYTFHADGIRNLIVKREDKPDIVVPFTEIISALEEK